MYTELADRLRKAIGKNPAVAEVLMFGGLCFTLNGNMQIAARRDGSLLARVSPGNEAAALKQPGVKRMVMRGREMAGYLIVAAEQLDEKDLRDWVTLTAAHVATLPPKKKKK